MSSDPITGVYNDAFIAEVFESYRRDPASVEASWRQFFRMAEALGGGGAADVAVPAAPLASYGTADPAFLRKVAGAAALGLVCGRAQAQFYSPVEKKWTVQEKDDKGEVKDVLYMSLDGVLVHETDPAKAPQPRVDYSRAPPPKSTLPVKSPTTAKLPAGSAATPRAIWKPGSPKAALVR